VSHLSPDDRLDIDEVMYRFAAAIDTCNWAEYRGVFTDEIDVDYSSWRAESLGRYQADAWVDRGRRLFPGLDASQHTITNVRVTSQSADTAQVTAYVRADHVLLNRFGDSVFTCAGFYTDSLVRTHAGWLIAAKRLTVRWTEGNRDIMRLAAERAAALLTESTSS
jgi:3-phenylpropionate/cinnamic acid dioxygenase small subunit